MNRDTSLQAVGRVLALVLAVALIAQGAMMGALAEAWDSETTNTGTTSDVNGATTVTYQPYDDTTQTLHLEISGGSSGTEYAAQFIDPRSGTVYYENKSPTNPASGHYAWDVDHAELDKELPHSVDASDVNVRVVDGNGNVLVGPATVTVSPNDTYFNKAKVAVGAEGGALGVDALSAEDVTDAPFGIDTLGNLGLGDEKTVAESGFTVGINNDTAPVVLEIENADAQAAFDGMVEGAAEEDRLDAQLETTRAGAVPLYYGAAPSDAPDTHAVVNDADGDGTEEIEMQLGADAYGDAQQLDADLVLNKDYGPIEQFQKFGLGGFQLPDLPSFGGGDEESSN